MIAQYIIIIKQMFSNIKTEYLFKIIEPPFAPLYKFKPSRSIICIMGTFFGGLVSIFIVLFRRYFLKSADTLKYNQTDIKEI